jgi:hypothetical protein
MEELQMLDSYAGPKHGVISQTVTK